MGYVFRRGVAWRGRGVGFMTSWNTTSICLANFEDNSEDPIYPISRRDSLAGGKRVEVV
jgi:hypothetical protein